MIHNDYGNFIKQYCHKNNVICSVRPANYGYFYMRYKYPENELLYNIRSIKELKDYGFTSLTTKEVILIILCHEIGHYVSLNEMGNLYYEINKDSIKKEELNAWEYGIKYVPKHLISRYKILREVSIGVF